MLGLSWIIRGRVADVTGDLWERNAISLISKCDNKCYVKNLHEDTQIVAGV